MYVPVTDLESVEEEQIAEKSSFSVMRWWNTTKMSVCICVCVPVWFLSSNGG